MTMTKVEIISLMKAGQLELPEHIVICQENDMDYQIREIRQEEYPILDEFLYEAIFIPDGVEAPLKSIIRQPELQVYVSDFGKKDDCCLVAEVNGIIVGAVWTRIMNDYGHVDDTTPSFAISLYKDFRGQGIGTVLMEEMIALLRERGYQTASLSVQKENYAYRLYLKVGFIVVEENEEEYIMVCDLKKANADSNVMKRY